METFAEFKGGFFDRAAILRSLDRAKRRALGQFGAFVRTRSKTSIRKRKGTSRPGSPPFSHAGHLRKFIFFAYDSFRESVVIGPVLFGKRTGAPERLEYGGTGMVSGGRMSGGKQRPRRVANYHERPYMRPAFRAELPKAPQMFKDMLR